MENIPDPIPQQVNPPPLPPPIPHSFPPVPSCPPRPANTPPAVLDWYRAFCILSAVLYVALILIGILLLVIHPEAAGAPFRGDTPLQLRFFGILYILFGFFFMIPYLFGLFIPPRPWGWIYGLIMICLSMNNCCCLPISIPLLVFWIKPETQAFFGRMRS